MAPLTFQSTYRVQLNQTTSFEAVERVSSYIEKLGISHLYTSPIFQAIAGSLHGYDVVNPNEFNVELGGGKGFFSLLSTLRSRNLGILVDVVPNHMAIGKQNPYWWDLLKFGRSSPYAKWFDIDWTHTRSRILLPILGQTGRDAVESGELTLALENDELQIAYFDHRFPLAPGSYPLLFSSIGGVTHELFARARRAERKWSKVLATLRKERINSRESLAQFWTMLKSSLLLAQVLRDCIAYFNSGDGRGASWHRMLRAQHYELTHWRRAQLETSYRRFFDVNELVALRMEDPENIRASHEFLFQLVRAGSIDGLRIDHVDGLREPAEYLRIVADELNAEHLNRRPFVVEKILGAEEQLPDSWPVDGTTGYDFLAMVDNLFLEPAGVSALEQWYQQRMRGFKSFASVCYRAKRKVLETTLLPDVRRLVEGLREVAKNSDTLFTLNELRLALIEVLASFPVYRSYISASDREITPADRSALIQGFDGARSRMRAKREAISFVEDILTRDFHISERTLEFALRFQQLAGSVAAKGVEDTAFFRYLPICSRNEVGNSPATSLSDVVAAFHEHNARIRTRFPHTLTTLSTHDSKRSADARYRISVLSEMPKNWIRAVREWDRLLRDFQTRIRGRQLPDWNVRYLFYQTLIGSWPLNESGDLSFPTALPDEYRERVEQFMIKAVREAKDFTSWHRPDSPYEEALLHFVRNALGSPASGFLERAHRFGREIVKFGLFNSLSARALQLSAPGVPDIYQGDELWNFTLVDPDNRRPVDFQYRAHLLEELQLILQLTGTERIEAVVKLVERATDDRLKLFLIAAMLAARRARTELFLYGSYEPLEIRGGGAGHVVCFMRRYEGGAFITVAPRYFVTIGNHLQDATVVLPDDEVRSFRNIFTGEEYISFAQTLSVSDMLRHFPVAALSSLPIR